MSVNDEAEFPWLVEEMRFVHGFMRTRKPVLGICLGAQLIAGAMGARVYRHRTAEIGWFPVKSVSPAGGSTFHFPPSFEAFQWHGETFDMPTGAVCLASSKACQNQAFQVGRAVVGLQFHLETTPQAARDIVAHCIGDLKPSRYVQSEDAILAASPEKYRRINDLMGEALSYLVGADG